MVTFLVEELGKLFEATKCRPYIHPKTPRPTTKIGPQALALAPQDGHEPFQGWQRDLEAGKAVPPPTPPGV